jgi:hypothetical protein
VPFGHSDIRRNISHTEASNVAADLLSIDHRSVPKPVVTHRIFHSEFADVPVHDHKNEQGLHHLWRRARKRPGSPPRSDAEPPRDAPTPADALVGPAQVAAGLVEFGALRMARRGMAATGPKAEI